MWQRIVQTLFNEGATEAIFKHASNLLVSTLILAAGLHATRSGKSIPSVINVGAVGYIVAAIGGALLILNLADGLRKLSKLRQHVLLQLLLVLVYAFVSVRVAQLVLAFRTG
jgi:hypothetical protein